MSLETLILFESYVAYSHIIERTFLLLAGLWCCLVEQGIFIVAIRKVGLFCSSWGLVVPEKKKKLLFYWVSFFVSQGVTPTPISLFGFRVSLLERIYVCSICGTESSLNNQAACQALIVLFLCRRQSVKDLFKRFNAILKFLRISEAVSYPLRWRGFWSS